MFNPKAFIKGNVLPGAVAVLYTVPNGQGILSEQILEINLCNTSGSPVAVTLYFVPAGSAPGVATSQYNITLQANDTKTFGRYIVMGVGDSVQALAGSAGVVSLSANGVSQT